MNEPNGPGSEVAVGVSRFHKLLGIFFLEEGSEVLSLQVLLLVQGLDPLSPLVELEVELVAEVVAEVVVGLHEDTIAMKIWSSPVIFRIFAFSLCPVGCRNAAVLLVLVLLLVEVVT